MFLGYVPIFVYAGEMIVSFVDLTGLDVFTIRFDDGQLVRGYL